MSSIFRMGRHHDHDSSSSIHDALQLVAEKDSLAHFVAGYSGPHETVKAVGKFLLSSAGAGIPWFRMYRAFPPWHQQSGLLARPRTGQRQCCVAMVFCTLLKPHSRKALGGGTWHSKGATMMGNEFVMTKLYHKDGANRPKEDGFTIVEFVLQSQPKVAICVLHPTDYRHLIRDLKQAAASCEESSAGPNQANQQVAVQHRLAPINPAPIIVDGFVNGCQVVGHTINPASNSESVGYQSTMYDLTWGNFSAMSVGYHPAPEDYAINQSTTYPINGGMYHTTLENMAMSAGNHLSLQNYTMNPWPMNGGTYDMTFENVAMSDRNYLAPQNHMMNLSNTWPMDGSMYDVTSENIAMTVGNHLAHENYTMHPPNAWSMNGGMHDMTLENIAMHTEQDAPAGQMSRQNSSITTSFGNSMNDITPNQNAMGENWTATAQNYTQDEYSAFLDSFGTHNSTF